MLFLGVVFLKGGEYQRECNIQTNERLIAPQSTLNVYLTNKHYQLGFWNSFVHNGLLRHWPLSNELSRAPYLWRTPFPDSGDIRFEQRVVPCRQLLSFLSFIYRHVRYYSVYLSIYLSIYQYVSMYLCTDRIMSACCRIVFHLSLFISISLILSIYLSIYLSLILSVYLYIYLSLFISIFPSIVESNIDIINLFYLTVSVYIYLTINKIKYWKRLEKRGRRLY